VVWRRREGGGEGSWTLVFCARCCGTVHGATVCCDNTAPTPCNSAVLRDPSPVARPPLPSQYGRALALAALCLDAATVLRYTASACCLLLLALSVDYVTAAAVRFILGHGRSSTPSNTITWANTAHILPARMLPPATRFFVPGKGHARNRYLRVHPAIRWRLRQDGKTPPSPWALHSTTTIPSHYYLLLCCRSPSYFTAPSALQFRFVRLWRGVARGGLFCARPFWADDRA